MKIMIILLVALAITLATTAAQEIKDPVADMITACTKNISKLAKWPGEKAIQDKNGPLFVAVVGESDLATRLKELNRTKTPNGHKLIVRLVDSDLLPANAHAVIICLDDPAQARKVTKKLTDTGSFTIAFGTEKVGALMHFQADPSEAGKVLCEVSQSVADAEKIEIQEALTLLAKIVE